jgi:tetratricopeptide (TPR) repeat protein
MNINIKKISIVAIVSFIILSIAADPNKSKPTIIDGLPITNIDQNTVPNVQAAMEAFNTGRWSIANRVFTTVTQTHPKASIGWIGQSKSAASLEQATSSLKMAKQLVNHASVAEKMFIDLQDAYLSGDSQRQMKITKKMTSEFPESTWAWIERGHVLQDHKKVADARVAFASARKAAPYKIGSYLASGDSYLFNEPKDMFKAQSFFQKAVNIQPTNVWAHIKLGDSHRAQQNLEQAYQDYTRASLLDPNNSIAIAKRGHVNSFLGNYEQARKDFDKAVKVSSDLTADYNSGGNFKAFTHLYNDDPKQALRVLETHLLNIETTAMPVADKNQARIKTLSNMTKIALHTKILDKAEKYITERDTLINTIIASLDNKDLVRRIRSDMHFYKGQLQAREGKLETALQSADKMKLLLESVKDQRKLEDYHELQALISIQKEQWGQAVAHYDKANTDKLYVKFHKAIALEQTGETKNAKKLFTQVAQHNFNSVDFALLRNSATKKIDLNSVASLH